VVWFKRFVDPHRGAKAGATPDAARCREYITAVPKAEHDAADWQVAWSPRAKGRKRFRESRLRASTETNRSKRSLARSQAIGPTSEEASRRCPLAVTGNGECNFNDECASSTETEQLLGRLCRVRFVVFFQQFFRALDTSGDVRQRGL
jgi:hypothetical protein